MLRVREFARSLPGIVLAFAICGCSDSAVAPVSGKLLVGGQPAGGADIYFRHTDPRVLTCPKARTEKDGSFRLMTNAIEDGARPGDYIVTFFWWDPERPYDDCVGDDLLKHDIVRGRFYDARISPLRATVRRGLNNLVIQAEMPDLAREKQAEERQQLLRQQFQKPRDEEVSGEPDSGKLEEQ